VISYVLDASVAVKWFLPPAGETLVPESLRILEDYTKGRVNLIVPDLFWSETGNVLWKAVRLGRMSRKSAEDAIQAVSGLKLQTWPSSRLLPHAFSIAVAFERAVYDCIYVAMAAASDKLLVTADERLSNALAAYFPIRWLGSIS
jgi:predicted nucleic acid-binding protein